MGRNFAAADLEQLPSSWQRTHLETPAEISPLEAYVALKALYGEPDREGIDEAKQQWAFLLSTDGAMLEVYDWKQASWSVAVHEEAQDQDRAALIAKDLVALITQTSRKKGREIKSLVARSVAQVIENPFALYYETAQDLLDLARKASKQAAVDPMASDEFPGWLRQLPLCRAAFFQFAAAIEGLLNLVYDLYLKEELRDERIVDRLSREQIDVKLRLAPVYCECFLGKPVDHTTQAFRQFHRLAQIRNDFIHANLTRSMRTPIVVHDGARYLIQSSVSAADGSVPASFNAFGIKELERVKAAVDAITQQLLACMKPKFRREFEVLMNEPHIEVTYR